MDKNLVEIVCVVDRSGSMSSIRDDAEGGLNSLIREQRENIKGKKVKLTLAQFDNFYEILWSGRDIDSVPEYKLYPRGSTALLEAVTRTIDNVGNRLAETPEHRRPGRVIFIIVTDGQENASDRRIYSEELLKSKIEHQRNKYSWEFIFLGCDENTIQTASLYGIPKGMSATYTNSADGMRCAYSNMSNILFSSINNNASVSVPDDISNVDLKKYFSNTTTDGKSDITNS